MTLLRMLLEIPVQHKGQHRVELLLVFLRDFQEQLCWIPIQEWSTPLVLQVLKKMHS